MVVEMPEFKQAQLDLELFQKELRNNLETIQVELNNKLAEFESGREGFSKSTLQLKEQEIRDLQNRLQRYYESAQGELQAKEAELTEPVLVKAQDAVKKIAAKGGYLAVYNTSIPAMVYYDEAAMTDLTPEVKKELGI